MRAKRPHVPKLGAVLARASKVALRVVTEEVAGFAHEHRDTFVQRIQDQDFSSFHVVFYPESGTNLSPRWLARKAAKGADSRTALATGHYLSQIKVFRKSRPRGAQWRVGFAPDARARDLDGNTQDITLNRVARVLEHGSEKMQVPARPHWGPHLSRMHKLAPTARVQVARRVVREIKKSMPDLGGS